MVVLKHPLERVWPAMRDDLPGLVTPADGIRELLIQERAAVVPAGLRVISIWQAEVTVPALAAPYVDPDMFRWTDDATWDEESHVCRWRITTHHHASHIQCAGTTRYEPALGGRGTRITMRGDFTWNLQGILDLPPGLENPVARGITAFVGGLIPRNFRQVAEAVRRHLDRTGA